MPHISIIVAAWNVENFIEQCLQSCLHSDYSAYELIIVDDASQDRTPELIERFIAKNSDKHEIRFIQKRTNQGLGQARNSGMDCAKGEYILFLDGDDWFADGILQKLQDVLKIRNPDVLMFSHVRQYSGGLKVANIRENLLNERDEYPIEIRRRLIDNLSVAWNKAYRRGFLLEHEWRFEGGIYEDINWSIPIILTAPHIYTIPHVGVNYRQRDGSILNSANINHFDALRALRQLLQRLENNPELIKNYGTVLHAYARRQAFYVIDQGRVPRNLIPDYTDESFALLLDYCKILSLKQFDIEYTILKMIGYRAYWMLRKLRHWRRYYKNQKHKLF